MIEAFDWVIKAYGQEMVCRRDRFLGLAEPKTPLDKLGSGGWLEWGGQRFEAMTVRPVWVGGQVTHLWLALRPCPEDGA